jgi:hypothetical protein
MNDDERQALLDFAAFVMHFVSRHGNPAEQAAILEYWQQLNEAFTGD